MTRFRDRFDAGRRLANELQSFAHDPDALVLALPRGGVPVAYEVATRLGLPLEIFLVRKLGVPGHEEFAMGAIASTGAVSLNENVVEHLGISRREVNEVIQREEKELRRRSENYGSEFSRNEVTGKKIILIDDGLATGSSMRAAVRALKQKEPQEIIVAVPVASASTCREFEGEVDEIICAETPEDFYAVGQWYDDFSQTSDEEVRELLAKAREEFSHSARAI
jgi:predicted phosphoribosyltransferase